MEYGCLDCTAGCVTGCWSGCTESCTEWCNGKCSIGCKDSCDVECVDSCDVDCNDSCMGYCMEVMPVVEAFLETQTNSNTDEGLFNKNNYVTNMKTNSYQSKSIFEKIRRKLK